MQLSLNLDSRLTFIQAIDDFIIDAGTNWSKATVETHKARLAVFAKWLKATHGLDNPRTVTQRHLAEYLNSLKVYSWYTHKASFEALRYFFRWAALTKIIESDIFDYGYEHGLLKMPRKPRMVKPLVDAEMIKKIILTADADSSAFGLRDAAMLRLMATTGIRRGEVVGLTLDDCYFSQSPVTFKINKGKGGDSRLVYPTPNTVKAVTAWLLRRPETKSPFVFVELRPPFDKITCVTLRERILIRAKKAGVQENLPSSRTFRYHYATQFINNGGSLAYLSELLGHEKIETTERYLAGRLPQMNRHALANAPEI